MRHGGDAVRRFALKLTLFLFLGAILDIAVAWGCAYFASTNLDTVAELTSGRCAELRQQMFPSLKSEKCELSEGAIHGGFGRCLLELVVVYDGEAYERMSTQPSSGSGPGGEEYYVGRHEFAGWPLLSLRGEVACDGPDRSRRKTATHGLLFPGRNEPEDVLRGYVLPLGIVASGFAINTIFYAAILWLLFAFPFVLRRRRRINRGLCPTCGYDLRASENKLCPECGVSASKPS